MRNLMLTETSDFSVDVKYARAVKKNKELINILVEDSNNQYSDVKFLSELEKNNQIIGIITEVKPLVMPINKLLIVKTKVNSKDLEDIEVLKSKLMKPIGLGMKNVLELPETFNRLDILLKVQKELSEYNIRFIGGNLFKINDLNIGYLSDKELEDTGTKKKVTLNSDLTYGVPVKDKEKVIITEEEYSKLLEEEKVKKTKPKKKSSPKKTKSASKGSKKSTSKAKSSIGKPKNTKTLKDIFGS